MANWNFNQGLTGWTKTGTAFDHQPTYGNNVTLSRGGFPGKVPLGGTYLYEVAYPIGITSNYWIGTYENRPTPQDPLGRVQGDGPIGTLTSDPFKITKNFITFLVGGGKDIQNLKVELLLQVAALDDNELHQQVVQLQQPQIGLHGTLPHAESPHQHTRFVPVSETVRTGMNLEMMRREWWDVQSLRGMTACIRITDNSSGPWGHINVADFRFQDRSPLETTIDIGSRNIPSVSLHEFIQGDPNSRGYIDWNSPIWGFVDMHTHPVAHLGFGEQLFYGAPYGDPTKVLHDCAGFHGNFFQDSTANEYRHQMVDEIEGKDAPPTGYHHSRTGFPVFEFWPAWFSVLHQDMWYEWVQRAWQGGLRVIVALAVNSHVLADGAETGGPNDDLRSMNNQINALHQLVDHNDFMELALDSTQLRDIVRRGNLAVIIGVEMDNIGNFYDPVDHKGATYTPHPTDDQIRGEIDRLYNLDVRYIFPIHLTNNVFGGAAIYDPSFNVANKYNTGRPFEVEIVGPETGISYHLLPPQDIPGEGKFAMAFTGTVIPGNVMPNAANYPPYPPVAAGGHRNLVGLTAKGEVAIKHMMGKGMMIDVDHMSEKAVTQVLEIARENHGYPLNSGHNKFRKGEGASENTRTREQYLTLEGFGGMLGFGFGGQGGDKGFAENLSRAYREINPNQIAIGTDVNGMNPKPSPSFTVQNIQGRTGPELQNLGMVQYNDYPGAAPGSLLRCRTGDKSWDYNTDGFAHYGLFPDMLQFLSQSEMSKEVISAFLNSAEYFAQMWQRCEWIASGETAFTNFLNLGNPFLTS